MHVRGCGRVRFDLFSVEGLGGGGTALGADKSSGVLSHSFPLTGPCLPLNILKFSFLLLKIINLKLGFTFQKENLSLFVSFISL